MSIIINDIPLSTSEEQILTALSNDYYISKALRSSKSSECCTKDFIYSYSAGYTKKTTKRVFKQLIDKNLINPIKDLDKFIEIKLTKKGMSILDYLNNTQY